MILNKIADKFRRVTSNQVYLAEIDGIRFLAFSLVAIFHINGYVLSRLKDSFADNPHNYGFLNMLLQNTDRSIPMFFAISGFILCVPFANHYLKNGKKIELKPYFIRRLTRLEPPYFIIMILLFFAQINGQI